MVLKAFIVDFQEPGDLILSHRTHISKWAFLLQTRIELNDQERVKIRFNLPEGNGVTITGRVEGPSGDAFMIRLPKNADTEWLQEKGDYYDKRFGRTMKDDKPETSPPTIVVKKLEARQDKELPDIKDLPKSALESSSEQPPPKSITRRITSVPTSPPPEPEPMGAGDDWEEAAPPPPPAEDLERPEPARAATTQDLEPEALAISEEDLAGFEMDSDLFSSDFEPVSDDFKPESEEPQEATRKGAPLEHTGSSINTSEFSVKTPTGSDVPDRSTAIRRRRPDQLDVMPTLDGKTLPDTGRFPSGLMTRIDPERLEAVKAMSGNQKKQLALSGNEEDRTILIQDPDRGLQLWVLKNPNIEEEEMLRITRQPSLTTEAIQIIVSSRKWATNPKVAENVLELPGTPPDILLRLLVVLPSQNLIALMNRPGVRKLVSTNARKILLDRGDL